MPTEQDNNHKENNDVWFKTYWRPAMAWQYLVVCVFDFLIAPMLTGWYSWAAKIPYEVWKPITMAEGGFYHMAMAAIVGISAWTRGREKISRITHEDVSDDFRSETERRIAKTKRRTNDDIDS
jgi:hypothetical protein